MAKLGASLGDILAAGQWKSLAFLRFRNAEDNIDPNQVLQLELDQEAEELDSEEVSCGQNATIGGGSKGDDGSD